MDKNTGYENLTIDHPMMEMIKASLNLAIVNAVDAAIDPSTTATVTLKLEISTATVGMEMIEEAPKELMPIDYTCTVSAKKKVVDQKGFVSGMVTKRTKDGMVAKNADEDQVSLFDGSMGD